MASLVLGGVGALIGASTGNPGAAWKGFQIGAAVGSLLEGFLNKPANYSAGLQDLKVQGAGPGVFIPIIFGTYRVPGIIFWAPDLHEHEGGSSGKLKGMPSAPTYTMDAGVMICKGEITRINKFWADSDLVYDYNGGTEIWAEYLTEEGNRFYPGSFTQTVDPLYDAERTAAGDEAPAMLGRACHFMEDFPWSRYGHTPNFTYEVVRGTYTLGEILLELFRDELGMDEADLDFTELDDIAVDGFAILSKQELVASIEGLLRAYHSDIIEVGGKLVGVKRVQTSSFTIAEEWIGVQTDSKPEVRVDRTRKSGLETVRAVDVRYVSVANDYQPYTQRAVRETSLSKGEMTLDIPLVLGENYARQLAEVMLSEEEQYSSPFEIRIAPRDMDIAPGDVGEITIRGETITVRVLDQNVNLLGHTECTVVRYDASIYTQTAIGATGGNGSDVVVPGQVYCIVRDLNALNDGDADYPTIYTVMSRTGPSWPGGEVTVYPDDVNDYRDRPQVYPWPTVPQRGVMGTCDTILADGAYGGWDDVSTVDVTLIRGELITRSESAVLRGMNLGVIGDEILQFKTATLLGPSQYRLSGLIRGRRGTEWAIATHGADEPFFLVDDAVEEFWPSMSQVGRELDFTGRVLGVDVTRPGGVADPVTETIEGKARKPYSPCFVAASRDGFGAITITWQRRARKNGVPPLWTVPLDETAELYEVDILDAPGGDVVRTLSVTSETATYSALDQVADFGSTQDPVNVVVYQVSPVIGRGFGRVASL